MEFNFNLEGGNFSRAGAASSEIKKILKQLNVDALLIKRIVVALYEAEVNVVAHAYEGVKNSRRLLLVIFFTIFTTKLLG